MMSLKSFDDWYNNLSAFEQYSLKDKKNEMRLEAAIRAGEIQIEYEDFGFKGFYQSPDNPDRFIGQLSGRFRIKKVKVD
jgi:hypothetical protein